MRKERFPGIDWYCDNCDALLNAQKGFDDHKYIWKCKECGYKNSISNDNIRYDGTIGLRILGFWLGWFRSACIYLIIFSIVEKMLNISSPLSFITQNHLIYFIGGYFVFDIFSMIFEKFVMKYCANMSIIAYVISTPFVYLLRDVIRPFIEVIKGLCGIAMLIVCKKRGFFFAKVYYLILYAPIVFMAVMLCLKMLELL